MTDTTSRALALLNLLQTHRHWPGSELADRLGVTERTVRRDVERLRELGYRIESAPGATGGYRLEAGSAVPPLLLTDDEAVAMAIGLRVAAEQRLIGGPETTLTALAKLEQVLPAALRRRVNALADAVQPAGIRTGAAVSPAVLGELALAVRDHERVRFSYTSATGAVTSRRVEPHALAPADRHWYLLCWDLDRDDWRTFRIDRMDAVTATTWPFRPRPGPDPAEAVRRAVAHAWRGTPYAVVYDAAPDAVAAAGWWGPEVRFGVLPDGRTEVRGEEDRLEVLAWYLTRAALTLDCGLTVVEPDALRSAFPRLGTRVAGFGDAVSAGT